MQMAMNAEYQSMYSSKYLSSNDVPKDGELLRAKIGKIELVELTDQKTNTTKRRLVAYFTGIEKPLIINKMNAKKLVAATGSEDRNDWLGLLCEIYVEETQLGDGVRLRVIKSNGAAAPAPKKYSADRITSGPIEPNDLNDEIPPLA
jgi:hypothetical protein